MIDRTEGAEYPYPIDQVFKAAMKGVAATKGMKLKKEDAVAHRMEIATGASATSWGDRIVITFTPVSSTVTRVSASSAPKTGAMLGGWMSGGHQAKNVSEVFGAITAQFEQTKVYKNQPEYEKDAPAWSKAGWELETDPQVDPKSKRLTARWRIPSPRIEPASAGQGDIVAKLQQLVDLKASGLLTDEEFNSKKAELLARI